MRQIIQAKNSCSAHEQTKVVAALKIPLLPATVLAALLGSLAILGWEPFGWWPLALTSYAALLLLVQGAANARCAGLIGLAFGGALHLAGHGWMYTTLYAKVGLSIVSAGLSTALFIFYLAAFTAVPCWLGKAFIGRRNGHLLHVTQSWLVPAVLYAGLLTLGEWGRSLFFNGFTSLSLGYSLIDTWFAGFAPVGGLYGTSWVGLCMAGLLPLLVTMHRPTQVAAVSGMILFALLGWTLNQVQWTQPAGTPLSYRLIQANVAQERKFDPLYKRQQAQHLVEIIEQAPADIIATPETAFPMFLNDLPGETLPRLRQFAQRSGSHIFAGIVTATMDAGGYNSVLQISPQQNSGEMTTYNKIRLMPFGEYSPPGFAWFTRSLNIPLKDLSSGSADQHPFVVETESGKQLIGTLICHEDSIGRDVRHWAASTGLLLNPSNLAWFEGSLAIAQSMQITRMRALEAGRPILRIANTGVTAHIDARGNLIQQLPADKEGALFGKAQPVKGQTPYAWGGDVLAVSLCIAGILLAIGVQRRYSEENN